MNHPIGLFDSGVGGTTIWRALVRVLPYESTLFLADSLNAPYGEKTTEEIIALCEKNTEYLLNHNSKLIIVACNTATTNAIGHLRNKYKVPFIGIEPAIKPAGLYTQTKVVGVLATQRTLRSDFFAKTKEQFLEKDITLITQEGLGLVTLIEEGKIETPEMYQLLEKYLQPMVAQGMDYLVLGCTHYPYLTPIISEILPQHIRIIDSADAVAKQTERILKQNNLSTTDKTAPEHLWLTNKNVEILQSFAPKEIKVHYESF
mgnify:FL=1